MVKIHKERGDRFVCEWQHMFADVNLGWGRDGFSCEFRSNSSALVHR